mgnify:CR=1 FL=1
MVDNQDSLEMFAISKDATEGIMLGLGALGEQMRDFTPVIKGLNTYFQKQEQIELQKTEIQKAEELKKERVESRQSLISDIVKEMTPVLQKFVQDLHADTFHKVHPKDKWPLDGGAEDTQVAAKLRSDTGEVQKPLQASQLKKHMMMDEMGHEHGHGEKEEKKVLEEPMVEPMVDETEEKEEEFPKKEEDYEMSEMKSYVAEIKALRKELLELKKGLNGDITKQANSLAEQQLKKMGYTKEVDRSPKTISASTLGLNDPTPIKKSADSTEDLIQLSFGELMTMKYARQAGQTDGIPKELLGQ